MSIRVLGDYNILKQIGQGSLGTVFLAEHRFMKRQYILKVLPEELASDKGFIQRFEEEVALLASLDHPHIVKIHNVSFSEGSYFLVMDCVVDSLSETTNLKQYLLDLGYRLKENELLFLVRQIADALDYAHSKRRGGGEVVHRGLKFNNILVGKGTEGKVDLFLSDFGLSRIIGTGAVLSRTYKALADALDITPVLINNTTGEERYVTSNIDSSKLMTLHNSFLQNYAFLAPEQKVIAQSQSIEPASDIYAFGVLVYHMITDKFPEGVFDMPSEVVPEYKMNWDLLICRCLQGNPEKRPTSLLGALDKLLQKSNTFVHPQKLQNHNIFGDEEQISYTAEDVATSSIEKTSDIAPPSEPIADIADRHSPPFPQSQTKTLTNQVANSFQSLSPQPKPNMIAQPEIAMAIHESATHHMESSLKPLMQKREIKRPDYDPDPGAIFSHESSVTHYQPKPREVKEVEPLLTDMVVIKGGVFKRGSNDGSRDELPVHNITLKSCALDVHPVTNEQFVRFLEAMGGEKDAHNNDIIRLRESRVKRSGGQLSIESGYSKHPVVGITWYGAVAYAKWVGKRLPTEAEWEVAARGNIVDVIYPTGNEIEKHQANFFSSDTTTVMSYPPNPFGLYDMAGNVYEWCQDWYSYNYYETSAQEPEDPQGPLQGVYRVLRGGCWKSLKEDLRCSHRHRNNPGTENRTYGFRCATDVQ